MSRQSISAERRAGVAELKQDLLGRLGLRADASDQEVEAAHNALVEFLELAPHEVKSWASAQSADLDEAFALLSGPEQDLVQVTAVAAMAQDGPSKTAAAAPVDFANPAVPATPAQASAPATSWMPAAVAGNKPLQKKIVMVAAAVLVVGVGFGVYSSGKADDVPGINGTPTATKTTQPSGGATAVPVDKAKVAALMTKVTANPKDVASLQALGDIYFAATDYKTAVIWERAVLGVDPKSKVALLGVGAAQFNLGNVVEAKKQWLVAAALYPKDAEVHYDLGFLYFSQIPPDLVNMRAEWKKVVAIDPTSSLAKTVATHLTSATSAPTGSATPSGK